MRTISSAVVWHELECGRYTADLPLWRGLAERANGPILEIGAGTGRVAIDLASRGHQVTALDHDQELLDELARRAEQLGACITVAVGDARDFRLDHRFALILAPMQTVQVLGGASGRRRFLACAAAHLGPKGRLAVAISERFELYDARGRDGYALPPPDVQERSGTVYVSQPTAVRQVGETIVLERRRETLVGAGGRTVELHQDQLDRLSAAWLEREAAVAGLRASGRVEIPATGDHVGSLVVMLDA
jgi:SAM-dependent methyltransferase